MCSSCAPYDTEIKIRGPAMLRRIAAKLQNAVRSGVLRCASDGAGAAPLDQNLFLELDLDAGFPDVMIYYFECNQCGTAFGLEVETYHGQGGTWSKR